MRTLYPVEDTILIDDGSSDDSPMIAERAGFGVIRHNVNLGVGAAIRTGIQHARERNYDFIAIMSSNGKMRPVDLKAIINPILAGEADYTCGSRFISGGSSPSLPLFRRIAIPVLSLITWPLLGRHFTDITCGFRCYTLQIFDHPQVEIEQSWLNRYEMETYIHYWACLLKLRIVEVPVVIPYSHLAKGRRSKIRPLTGWWSIVRPYFLLRMGIRK
jgi:glycosyltransferase involved in cell wall biosynthesis